jgi:hypothetical protein
VTLPGGATPPCFHKAAKLITCVLPDDGRDKALMLALRHEKQIITSSSIACRGTSVLESAKTASGRLPVPRLVKRVDIAVPAEAAEDLFDYIYEVADIGRQGGGVLFMGPLLGVTPFALPEGVPDEAEH